MVYFRHTFYHHTPTFEYCYFSPAILVRISMIFLDGNRHANVQLPWAPEPGLRNMDCTLTV